MASKLWCNIYSVSWKAFRLAGVNDGPVGVDDSYQATPATTLQVPALNGVLANDSDPDQDPLTAVLVGDVGNGTLTLNSDGSFSYTPAANFWAASEISTGICGSSTSSQSGDMRSRYAGATATIPESTPGITCAR